LKIQNKPFAAKLFLKWSRFLKSKGELEASHTKQQKAYELIPIEGREITTNKHETNINNKQT